MQHRRLLYVAVLLSTLLAPYVNAADNAIVSPDEPILRAMAPGLYRAMSTGQHLYTPAMKKAFDSVRAVHTGMDQETIGDVVHALHREVAQHDPEIFVPTAIAHLMRLAPEDTNTRALLRKALEKKWLGEYEARALLVVSGDDPDKHLNRIIAALDDDERAVRIRAMRSARNCGTRAKAAIPKLRNIVERSGENPDGYIRIYPTMLHTPDFSHAMWALLAIDPKVVEELRQSWQESNDSAERAFSN